MASAFTDCGLSHAHPPGADPDLVALFTAAGMDTRERADADPEEWAEQGYRALIAQRAGMRVVKALDDRVLGAPIWGPATSYTNRYTTDQQALAERYVTNTVFADPYISGRETFLSDPSRFCALVSLIGAGNVVWYKVSRTKTYIGRMDFTDYRTVTWRDVRDALDDPWMLQQLPDDPAALMVYCEVAMSHEYRLFVVDGHLVTGAGRVAEATPADNTERFDPVMRADAGSDQDTCSRPDLVARYRTFARDVAARLAETGLHTYALDVATGTSGPLVVEINGLLNAGLFASDWRALADAVRAAPDQFIARTTEG